MNRTNQEQTSVDKTIAGTLFATNVVDWGWKITVVCLLVGSMWIKGNYVTRIEYEAQMQKNADGITKLLEVTQQTAYQQATDHAELSDHESRLRLVEHNTPLGALSSTLPSDYALEQQDTAKIPLRK